MKRINKITILTMVIITLTLLIGATQQTNSTSNDIKSIETTATGSLITYDDNTGYYIDFNEIDNNIVEFINNKQNKLNINNKVTVTNILYESTNDFYLSEGEIGVEFSDGSWVSANLLTNEYTFQPYKLGDWSLDFDNLKDLENCVKTYLNNNEINNNNNNNFGSAGYHKYRSNKMNR